MFLSCEEEGMVRCSQQDVASGPDIVSNLGGGCQDHQPRWGFSLVGPPGEAGLAGAPSRKEG
jgi:hypothetical protein